MKAKHVGAQLRKAISGILAAAMVMTSITVPTYAKVDEEVIEIETEGEGLEASDAKKMGIEAKGITAEEVIVSNKATMVEDTGEIKNYIQSGDFSADIDYTNGTIGAWKFDDTIWDSLSSLNKKGDWMPDGVSGAYLSLAFKADSTAEIYEELEEEISAGVYAIEWYQAGGDGSVSTKAYVDSYETSEAEVEASNRYVDTVKFLDVDTSASKVGLKITGTNGAWYNIAGVSLISAADYVANYIEIKTADVKEEAYYTEDSYKTYTDAIAKADDLSSKKATEIQEILTEIDEAIEGLEPKEEEPPKYTDLYVYSLCGTPYFACKGSTLEKVINTETYETEEFPSDSTAKAANSGYGADCNWYKLEESDYLNWYKLPNVVIDTSKTGQELFEIVVYDGSDYTWKINIKYNATENEWNKNIDGVLDGKKYINIENITADNTITYEESELEKTVLEAIQTLVEKVKDYDEADYDDVEKWSTFTSALTEAKKYSVKESIGLEDAAKATTAYNNLLDAKKALDAIKTTRLKDLKALLIEAANIKTNGAKVYTEETFEIFKEKYEDAEDYAEKKSEEDDDYTDETLSEIYQNLVNAINNLKKCDKTITLNYYNEDTTVSDEYSVAAYDSIRDYVEHENGFIKGSEFSAVDGKAYWYASTFTLKGGIETVTEADYPGIAITDAGWKNKLLIIELTTTKDLYTAVVIDSLNGDSLWIKGGIAYSSYEDAMAVTRKQLESLIANAEKFKESDFTKDSYTKLQEAIAAAKEVSDNPEAKTEDFVSVYYPLKEAVANLVSEIESEIGVEPVMLADDFMAGADLSSFIALREAGTVFKNLSGNALNDQEFFDYLAEGGTNYVRIRVWNDPYDSNGNGYGGGNNDVDKAIKIGKLATKAGMKVLIDFHYSDFWVDPSKYKAPKAWKNLGPEEKAEALYNFTYDSLDKILAAGVDVGMVQIGNEANHGIAEETDGAATILYGYGCEAVDAISAKYSLTKENGDKIIKAVHFTDIQDGAGTVTGALEKQLKNQQYNRRDDGTKSFVQYDAIGISYYPMLGHGNIENLEQVISKLSASYGPGGASAKVFVAETSYPTTWEDGDGFSNQGPAIKGQDISQYPISQQGQADMMRAIAKAVTNQGGLGMFYWEPAWISPYQACYEDYSVNPTLYAKNQKAWEQYGAGWASSYAYEYDPTDAGLYYGGSSMDNQSWFDFDGTALPLVNIYKYIKEGCSSTKLNEVGEVRYNQKTDPYELGTAVDDIIKAIKVEVYRNNGVKEILSSNQLVWNQSDLLKIDTDKAGFYYIYGKTVVEGKTWPIACEIEITGDNNVILSNGNFDDIEDSTEQNVKFTDWDMYGLTNREESPVNVIDYKTPFKYDANKYSINSDNAKSVNALNFYYANRNLDLTLYQKVGKIGKGSYTFGGYIEGKSGGEYDQQFAVAYVYESEDQFKEDLAEVYSDPTEHRLGDNALRRYSSSVQFAGWKNWQKPEIKDIIVAKDDYVVVGFQINGVPSGTWGSVDDAYMYGNYGVKLETVENGSLTASNFFPGSNQSVSVTARHDKGYKLASITVSGNGVTSDCFKSKGWSVDEDDKVATYTATADDQSQDSVTVRFTMPQSEVSVSANFESLFKKGEKININSVPVSSISIGGKSYTEPTEAVVEFFTNGTKKVEPYVALEYNGYKLTSSDFTAQYASGCNKVGTFEITITGKGKFEGTRKLTYKLIEETRKDISVKDALTFVFAEKATDNIIFARVNGVVKNGADGKDPEYYYNGLDIKPIVTVKYGDTTLTPDTDYTVAYEKNNKVGTATMTIVGKNDYKGSVDKKFKIVKADFKVLIANDDEGKVKGPIVVNRNNTISATTWDEKGAQPNIGIWYGSIMLRAGKDYSVSFKNNKKISDDKTKVSVTITGKGNYTGKWEKEFKVIPKNLSDNVIEVIAEDLVENKGRALKPKFVVATTEKHKSIGNKNYTYKVLDNEGNEVKELNSKGNYTLEITGKNYYQGTIKADFRVIDKDHIITKSNVSFGKIYYQGKAIKLGDGLVISESSVGKVADNSIRIKVGTKVLSANDFEIASYEKNSGAGKARVVIKGKGDYAGQVVTTFSINKLKLVNYDKYAALVKDNKAMGYATVNAVSANALQQLMKEDTTYKKRQVYTGYTKTPEFTVNVLINGVGEAIDFTPTKDYKIQYANNVNPGKVEAGGVEYEGKTYKKGTGVKTTFSGKGNFSGSSVYKDAFFIEPRTVDDLDVSVENATYEGKRVKAEVKFVDIATGSRVYLNPSKCYSVSYKNNNMISRILGKEPHVVVKMKGYAASADKTKNTRDFDFIISAGTITMNSMDVIKAQKYNNGKPVTPKVKVVVNGKTLKENVDYIIEYANNYDRYAAESSIEGDAATPKATVIGIGNYTGTAYRYFTIK